jgi:pyruvate kinase
LFRNVRAFNLAQSNDREYVLAAAEKVLLDQGVVKRGDTIVVTWGEPMGQVGGTNAMKIVKVGEY